MDSSPGGNRKQDEEKKREDEIKTSLMDVNLMVVLLSQLCTKNEKEKDLEEERRRGHVAHAHEARKTRARENKRLMKETKLMEKKTHVLHPMAKEFRHYRKM